MGQQQWKDVVNLPARAGCRLRVSGRVLFGTKKSEVQILSPRPHKSNKIN
jgi:hypothetical protein